MSRSNSSILKLTGPTRNSVAFRGRANSASRMSIVTTTTPSVAAAEEVHLQHDISANILVDNRSVSLNLKNLKRSVAKDPSSPSSAAYKIILETEKSKQLISNALFNQVQIINHETCEAGAEDSFFVCDLGKVERLWKIWKQKLPRVHPFYAVKCNPNLEVVRLLASMGANFDCASKGEIDLVLSLGVDPSRIIYANPCKVGSFLRFAKNTNVNFTTFDNADELYKIKKFHPECKLLLRIITDDESAQCRLSTKFGASMESVPHLLKLAKDLDLEIAGVSFHVGSGANDNNSLIKAVKDARTVFELGTSLRFDMNVLDVGGGFSYESFETSSNALNYALNEHFSVEEYPDVQVIAEPGRFFVANAFTLATHIIARRSNADSETPTMIYLNDGVYGNMNCILFDHQAPKAHVLSHNGEYLYGENNPYENDRHNVSIWGPTCDGLDCIAADTHLSHNVSVGDWLYFPNLGAYTSAAASPFNGFKADANTVYVNSESA